MLDMSRGNVELADRLVKAGTPVVLTSLFTRPSSPGMDAQDFWLNAQLATLEQPTSFSC